MNYTDAQLVVLSAASQREDGLLPRPVKLAGAVLRSFEASLVKARAAEPISVRPDQPSWRLDEAEMPIGLRITARGLAGIGIQPAEPVDHTLPEEADDRLSQDDAVALSEPPTATRLRAGTKRALLVELLSAAEGTSVESLVTALQWQRHTVRAALTRLRQDGFAIVATKDAQKPTLYRIDSSAAESVLAEPTDVLA